MDDIVDKENLMKSAMLKAKDLATMGHPSYTLTKELFIKDVATKINNALDEIDPSVQN
jgi:enoyl-CoA hydratase